MLDLCFKLAIFVMVGSFLGMVACLSQMGSLPLVWIAILALYAWAYQSGLRSLKLAAALKEKMRCD